MARPAATAHRLLRAATSELHLQAERQLGPLLLGEAATPATVCASLRALHGFHAPLERRLRAAAGAIPFALVDRATRIELDLARLGGAADDLARVPPCRDLPPVTGAADAAGCLYVIEGSQLGGQVIARQLARRFGIRPDTGAGFFAGDGATATLARWREVLAWIEAVAGAPGGASAVVASARATFDALTRHLALVAA